MTQIVLGIVSNDLKVKQRLPSTRDLARRYQIHANTVSAAYRELARRGWVEFRKGSGVYVRQRSSDEGNQQLDLDQLIARFFRTARSKGHSLAEIQAGLQRALSGQPPDHFLLIEADDELRQILIAEIAQVAKAKVNGARPEDLLNSANLTGALPMTLFGHAESVRPLLTQCPDLLVLNSASVVESMQGQTRPPADALIAIVSRWPEFLRWARTMLLAAGLDEDSLSFRDARRAGWEKGLRAAAFVITDSLMAPRIPRGCETKIFRVIAEASLRDIQDYTERYF